MKLSVAFIALFASIAFAQTPSLTDLGFPKCAIDCINQGNQQAGCTGQDPRCGCGKAASEAVAKCINDKTPCSAEDGQKLQQAGDRTCASVNGGSPKSQAKNSTTTKTSNAGSLDVKAATGLMGLIGAAAMLAV